MLGIASLLWFYVFTWREFFSKLFLYLYLDLFGRNMRSNVLDSDFLAEICLRTHISTFQT